MTFLSRPSYTVSDMGRRPTKQTQKNFRFDGKSLRVLEEAAARLGIDQTAVLERLLEKLGAEPNLLGDVARADSEGKSAPDK